MNYKKTIDFMFDSLPMYHRVGKAAYKADMNNTVKFMRRLGNPENRFKSIHVAGTNGKGSVSHMLASILQQSGLKVGLYTSPHLVDFRERIRINGEMIPEKRVIEFVESHKAWIKDHKLSFFEMTVGLAFDYFAKEKVDIAVVEVGMGGRLDSTNVITPRLSIITNIGYDHTQFLGKSLGKIAGEKAGIIKEGVPVVIGESKPSTAKVFDKKAAEMNAPIVYADRHWRVVEKKSKSVYLNANIYKDGVKVLEDLHSPLDGWYQRKNLATLMQAVEALKENGFIITEQHIRVGIESVIIDTGLHGRWEVVASRPTTICETAHNEDGIRCLVRKLNAMKYNKLHIVYGCVNDKDANKILDFMPREAHYYITAPSVPRAMPVADLTAIAQSKGLEMTSHESFLPAYEAAREAADKNDLIIITGSIFLVADAMRELNVNIG